jgi:hypothetical protein
VGKVPEPEASWAPASLDFGAAVIGTSDAQALSVTNSGTGTLNITDITVSSPVFAVQTASVSVAPGQSGAIQLSFQPASATSYTGSLSFQTNDPNHPTVSVPASGVGKVPEPEASWAPASLDFGNTWSGLTAIDTLSIANVGTAVLNVSDVVSSNSEFTVEVNSLQVPAGQTGLIEVAFNADTISASHVGIITFQTHDPNNSQVTISMAATTSSLPGCSPAALRAARRVIQLVVTSNRRRRRPRTH